MLKKSARGVKNITRSAKDDALNEEEFQKLLDACDRIEHTTQNKFIVLVAGRLGLRKAEIGHMTKEWVDFEEEMIHIPNSEPCDCGYCREQAKQMMQYNDLSFEKALNRFWSPKTEAASRNVPFHFNRETAEIIKKTMTEYGGSPLKTNSINGRLNKIADTAGLEGVYPHALRATAAMRFAYDGLDAFSLMTIMGWKDIETAQKYIRASGSRAKASLSRIYDDDDMLPTRSSRTVIKLTDRGREMLKAKRNSGEPIFIFPRS